MAHTYRPNPDLTIEAIQWTGTYESAAEITEFTENGFNTGRDKDVVWAEVYDYLQTDWVNANIGDYIIRGTKDEFYPCEEGVFKHKYILAEDTDANELGLYEGELKK